MAGIAARTKGLKVTSSLEISTSRVILQATGSTASGGFCSLFHRFNASCKSPANTPYGFSPSIETESTCWHPT
ncbi:uncharacterized protein SETTUDRAFT_162919 [Exserohilum turcica Et28A]|uniref:Uncharacterized protein n=1 Tax=Exserohilum turcicum (strain 28A) TaxID=671987 RepID=R0IPU3_EXST2|nr:uncharacterized protein SETTUDRAFT_162919 [Exserohilum turcica Et28A]EOA86731.1 hypothetical protein SETTUDRAFT_162919 [Exserohilum turcica Et28A]